MPEQESETILSTISAYRTRLASDNIWGVYVEMRQNQYFSGFLHNHESDIASAFQSGNVELARDALLRVCGDTEKYVASLADVAQLAKSEESKFTAAAEQAQRVDPNILKEQAAALAHATESAKRDPLVRKPANRAFIHGLVNQWVVQNKAKLRTADAASLQNLENKLATNLEGALIRLPDANPTALLAGIAAETPEFWPLKEAAQPATSQFARGIQEYQRREKITRSAVVNSIVLSPNPSASLAYIENVLGSSKGLLETNQAAYRQTFNAVAAGGAEMIAHMPETTRSTVIRDISGGVFTTLAQTPLQKAIAPVADWFNSVVMPKGEFLDRILEKSMRRLGADAIASPLFAEIVHNQQMSAQEARSGAASLLQSFSNITSDLTGAVFKGPIDQSMDTYLRMTALRRSGSPAFSPGIGLPGFGAPGAFKGGNAAGKPGQQPTSLQMWYFTVLAGSDMGQFLLQFGGEKLVSSLVGTTLQGAAAKLGFEGFKKGAVAAASKTGIKAAITAVFGASGPPGWLVAAATWVGDVFVGRVLGFAGSVFKNIFTGSFFTKIISGSGKFSFKEDPFLIFVVVFIGFLILSVVPVGFMIVGAPTFFDFVRDSAIAISIEGDMGQSNGPIINCQTTPNDPACSFTPCDPAKQDCRWPASGPITQSPDVTCNPFASHRPSSVAHNAIDIGASFGSPVYATANATVLFIYSGCADHTGFVGNTCGGYPYGGYGNVIVLQRDEGGTLIFGHLEQASVKAFESTHPVGSKVTPTEQIAQVDHNGNSTGSHLHFELRGAGNINSILPVGNNPIVNCSNGTLGCQSCNRYAGGP